MRFSRLLLILDAALKKNQADVAMSQVGVRWRDLESRKNDAQRAGYTAPRRAERVAPRKYATVQYNIYKSAQACLRSTRYVRRDVNYWDVTPLQQEQEEYGVIYYTHKLYL